LKITIRQPDNAKDFDTYYQLRWEVLHKPWMQPKGSEKDEFEDSSIHLIAEINNAVEGVCRIQVLKDNIMQIKFMAVSESFREQGIGSALLLKAEEVAASRMMSIIILQARENAVGFYSHHGFTIVEKSFLLFNSI
jgi:ribosomal protein S18 acetylase RimI-like enzyme